MTTWANAAAVGQTGNSINQPGRGEIPFPFKKVRIMRLDTYSKMPSGMKEYLEAYGWHFSKKMCEWATGKMKAKDETGKPKKLDPMKKDEVEEMLKKYNVKLERDAGYDAVYVANMAKSDFFKSAITDEQHLALFVKDYIDDVDAYEGMPFTRFFADCVGSGKPVNWEDML